MNISGSDIKRILGELTPLLPARIQKIHQPSPQLMTLELYFQGGAELLLLSTRQNFARFHFTQRRFSNPANPGTFCLFLRRRLLDFPTTITGLSQQGKDRVVVFELETKGESGMLRQRFSLELFGPRPNLFLLDEAGVILGRMNESKGGKRALGIGDNYVFPKLAPKNESDEAKCEEPNAVSGPFGFQYFLDREYQLKEVEAEFQVRREQLGDMLHRHESKLRKTIANLEGNLSEAESADLWQRRGELLKASLHLVKKGMKEIELIDYYEESAPRLLIPLDPMKGGRENLEIFFKRYRKLCRSAEYLSGKIENTKSRLNKFLEAKLDLRLEASRNMNDLIRLEDAMKNFGALVYRRRKPSKDQSKGHKEYESRDGWKILVGRSAKENDQLTCKTAKSPDLWLHVGQGMEGSHVLVPTPKNKSVPLETLLDAAQLAKHHSKAKDALKVEIHYTPKKYVSKPRKAPPGLVTLGQFKTILIEMDTARLKRLLGEKDEG